MDYRILSREEISNLSHIDRTESVDRIYYYREGKLVLEEEHWDVPDWSTADKQQRIAILQQKYDQGATFFGAFDETILVGIADLIHKPLLSGESRLNMGGLWVSCPYRGKGIGRTLVGLVIQKARERGAKSLYVSATPSEHTIRFYKSVGLQPTVRVDPDLYEKEPEDIHLEMFL